MDLSPISSYTAEGGLKVQEMAMMANGGSRVDGLGVHGFWKSPNGSNRMSVQYESYTHGLTDQFKSNVTFESP